LRRIGKRIAIGLDGDLWLVLHLMIAGRLHWRSRGASSRAGRIWPRSIFPTARW
jgi:formamidopyrimidine-DNA glycosylase